MDERAGGEKWIGSGHVTEQPEHGLSRGLAEGEPSLSKAAMLTSQVGSLEGQSVADDYLHSHRRQPTSPNFHFSL